MIDDIRSGKTNPDYRNVRIGGGILRQPLIGLELEVQGGIRDKRQLGKLFDMRKYGLGVEPEAYVELITPPGTNYLASSLYSALRVSGVPNPSNLSIHVTLSNPEIRLEDIFKNMIYIDILYHCLGRISIYNDKNITQVGIKEEYDPDGRGFKSIFWSPTGLVDMSFAKGFPFVVKDYELPRLEYRSIFGCAKHDPTLKDADVLRGLDVIYKLYNISNSKYNKLEEMFDYICKSMNYRLGQDLQLGDILKNYKNIMTPNLNICNETMKEQIINDAIHSHEYCIEKLGNLGLSNICKSVFEFSRTYLAFRNWLAGQVNNVYPDIQKELGKMYLSIK